MNRELSQIADGDFDLCVVGGGIYGACVARDAALRGMSVALIEMGDFGNATTFNSQKTIHGGFRYLQNLDFARMRNAIRDRRIWMGIAPHLVHPLPFLIPTYRSVKQSRELLSLALRAYDLISFDRNTLDDPQKHLPGGRIISKQEFSDLVPSADVTNMTGAAKFYDGQVYNSERLVISVIKSAAKAGASVANYAEATDFLMDGNRVTGVMARDTLAGQEFEVRARTVVNTSGPWVNRLLERLNGRRAKHVNFMKLMYLIVSQPVPGSAVGLLSKDSGYYFLTPWHKHSLIGVSELPYEDGDLDGIKFREKHVQDLIDEINGSRPYLGLRREDVVSVRGGLLPMKDNSTSRGAPQLATNLQILDHSKDSNVDGLVSAVGVKFTTSRRVAEGIVNLVFRKQGYKPPRSISAETPVYGGDIARFDEFLSHAIATRPDEMDEETVKHLVYSYGSAYTEVLRCSERDPRATERVGEGAPVLKAEVVHGIREEMAVKLSDVVMRRTELGALGSPGEECLRNCASIMAEELGWDLAKTNRELEEVRAALSVGGVYA